MNLSRARWLLSALCLMSGVGCVEPGPDAEAPEADAALCAEASAHLSECLGAGMTLDARCDPEVAREVLAQECGLLNDPGKADFIGDWLCRLGFLYHCPMVLCALEEPLVGALEEGRCEDFIGVEGCQACDYYLCRELRREQPCGDRGYAMGFARHYCQLFTELTVPRLSPKGQQWIADVRPCLQMALEDIGDDVSCQETQRFGYDSHPGCYVGTGFCELPVSDMLAILNTVAPQDLGVQPFFTGIECVRRWFDPETLEPTDEGREALVAEGQEPAPQP